MNNFDAQEYMGNYYPPLDEYNSQNASKTTTARVCRAGNNNPSKLKEQPIYFGNVNNYKSPSR